MSCHCLVPPCGSTGNPHVVSLCWVSGRGRPSWCRLAPEAGATPGMRHAHSGPKGGGMEERGPPGMGDPRPQPPRTELWWGPKVPDGASEAKGGTHPGKWKAERYKTKILEIQVDSIF